MDQSILINLLGEDFIFDSRRAIYWPSKKTLIAADLHWGKTQYLRNHGVAISDRVFEEDLLRLSSLYSSYDIDTFLVLGDLIHHEKALDPGVIKLVHQFRNAHPSELILLKGNHDRFTEFPDEWGIVEEQDFYFKNFYFSHDYAKGIKEFQFSGHIHPLFKLRAGPDVLKLPTYILDQGFCLLPAFSYFTGGQVLKLNKGQKALVITEDHLEVFEKN